MFLSQKSEGSFLSRTSFVVSEKRQPSPQKTTNSQKNNSSRFFPLPRNNSVKNKNRNKEAENNGFFSGLFSFFSSTKVKIKPAATHLLLSPSDNSGRGNYVNDPEELRGMDLAPVEFLDDSPLENYADPLPEEKIQFPPLLPMTSLKLIALDNTHSDHSEREGEKEDDEQDAEEHEDDDDDIEKNKTRRKELITASIERMVIVHMTARERQQQLLSSTASSPNKSIDNTNNSNKSNNDNDGSSPAPRLSFHKKSLTSPALLSSPPPGARSPVSNKRILVRQDDDTTDLEGGIALTTVPQVNHSQCLPFRRYARSRKIVQVDDKTIDGAHGEQKEQQEHLLRPDVPLLSLSKDEANDQKDSSSSPLVSPPPTFVRDMNDDNDERNNHEEIGKSTHQPLNRPPSSTMNKNNQELPAKNPPSSSKTVLSPVINKLHVQQPQTQPQSPANSSTVFSFFHVSRSHPQLEERTKVEQQHHDSDPSHLV
jgi:hypothetical protein